MWDLELDLRMLGCFVEIGYIGGWFLGLPKKNGVQTPTMYGLSGIYTDNRLITKNSVRNTSKCSVGMPRKSRLAPNKVLGTVQNTIQAGCRRLVLLLGTHLWVSLGILILHGISVWCYGSRWIWAFPLGRIMVSKGFREGSLLPFGFGVLVFSSDYIANLATVGLWVAAVRRRFSEPFISSLDCKYLSIAFMGTSHYDSALLWGCVSFPK